MQSPLPSNEDIEAFGQMVHWEDLEQQKRLFNEKLSQLRSEKTDFSEIPVELFSKVIGAPVTMHFENSEHGNIVYGHLNGQKHILASIVSERYRKDKPLVNALSPYNMNPAVNRTNLQETDTPSNKMRALGAELELGLFHRDGTPPTEDEVQTYIDAYRINAHRLGITPTVDREACQYQVEVHIAPGVGYHRTRQSLDGIMSSLVAASNTTQLQTAILACYPILSDFHLTPDPKVHTAVDVMVEINNRFPDYIERLKTAKARYNIPQTANVVETFRLQGCHIHLDIAGRSEALGLLTFATMLRSATAIANAAVLKGAPFVNGSCDAELLCTREYLRSATVTGRYIEQPLSPHLIPGDEEKFARLLFSERANAVVRGLLYDDSLGEAVSVMHNPIGRLRPDLSINKRICTLESTGMPVNISASRQAAVLTDFEFTHALVEHYFRRHGCNLEPMMEDKDLWAIVGSLSLHDYQSLQDQSDRLGVNMTLKTADGREMSLAEFYEMKRVYLHRHLFDAISVTPRDIDDVYVSFSRLLKPLSGQVAETVEQYIYDPMRRSTGNWGEILRNAFIEEGGTPGTHNPDAVLKVANRVHDALRQRYDG